MIFSEGMPETTCGIGSTKLYTVGVRAWLPGALERLGVKTLLDAPCGDRNWIRTVRLPCAYVGVDIEPGNVERAGADEAKVRRADIRKDRLPKCDAILSRDFFQHLSNADAVLALANMRKTGARWLIATCHGAAVNEDVETGGFRAVNMALEPFSLGEPVDRVQDGKRILGVWELECG